MKQTPNTLDAQLLNWASNDMSLAEAKGRRTFNWNRALSHDIILSLPNLKKMRTLACSWVTCACGNQCAIIPRDIYNSPEDEDLYILGQGFSESIDAMLQFADVLNKDLTELRMCDHSTHPYVSPNYLGIEYLRKPEELTSLREGFKKGYIKAQENAIITLLTIEELSTIVIEETIMKEIIDSIIIRPALGGTPYCFGYDKP